MERAPLLPPIIHPHRASVPVLLSIPHSGRAYPDWLVANALHGLAALESLEDPQVDRLAWRAIADGFGAVVARAPRAAVDCNRSPADLDPRSVVAAPGPMSLRARAGLGIIASRGAGHSSLWRRPIPREELERRVAEAHRPFHNAITDALDALAGRWGCAVLLDCHSMPSRAASADLVIGNRHGASAPPWLAEELAAVARADGWSVAINRPYAGGYVVERHGDPRASRHALQLEFNRRCYCASDERQAGPGFDRAARLLTRLAVAAGEIADAGRIAAE